MPRHSAGGRARRGNTVPGRSCPACSLRGAACPARSRFQSPPVGPASCCPAPRLRCGFSGLYPLPWVVVCSLARNRRSLGSSSQYWTPLPGQCWAPSQAPLQPESSLPYQHRRKCAWIPLRLRAAALERGHAAQLQWAARAASAKRNAKARVRPKESKGKVVNSHWTLEQRRGNKCCF